MTRPATAAIVKEHNAKLSYTDRIRPVSTFSLDFIGVLQLFCDEPERSAFGLQQPPMDATAILRYSRQWRAFLKSARAFPEERFRRFWFDPSWTLRLSFRETATGTKPQWVRISSFDPTTLERLALAPRSHSDRPSAGAGAEMQSARK